MIALSGPEPQRTIFENILLDQLQEFDAPVLFVRGLPGIAAEKKPGNKKIEIVNHLPSQDLCVAMQQSEIIISRSGYTTIMDLVKLQQPAILIPTPGQTEQEYLATYLLQQRMFYSVAQEKFSLKEALKKAAGFDCKEWAMDMDQYKKTVTDFVASL